MIKDALMLSHTNKRGDLIVGMYTEVMVKFSVNKESTPKDVIDVLMFLFGDKEKPDALPDHPYFSCSRWDFVGDCVSFYHHPARIADVQQSDFSDEIYIFARNDLKNYEDEIEKFFDWVDPYVSSEAGQCIGYSWYEECEKPTLICKQTRM